MECIDCGTRITEQHAVGSYCRDCATYHGLVRCSQCSRAVPVTAAVQKEPLWLCPACAKAKKR